MTSSPSQRAEAASRQAMVLKSLTDNRCQHAKQYWPITRASNKVYEVKSKISDENK